MNWFERLQKTLQYIEANLKNDLDTESICKVAFSSEFHFLRMFFAMTEMSLWEYIRKRRITLAAGDLMQSDRKIIDIALDYGYGNPESFTRAFKAIHGISPSLARKNGVSLVAFPPLTIHLSIKGEAPVNYRIEQKDRFVVKGITKQVSAVNEENFSVIPKFWQETMSDGTFEKLLATSPDGISYGVCSDYDEGTHLFSYTIAVDDTGQDGYDSITIPANKYTVFTCIGNDVETIQETTKKIFSEWFPATNFEHADGPELEVYLPGDSSQPDYRCEIWIPVRQG